MSKLRVAVKFFQAREFDIVQILRAGAILRRAKDGKVITLDRSGDIIESHGD